MGALGVSRYAWIVGGLGGVLGGSWGGLGGPISGVSRYAWIVDSRGSWRCLGGVLGGIWGGNFGIEGFLGHLGALTKHLLSPY